MKTNKKRKICVVITARPSYSRIKTALLEINKHPKLDLILVVAASALLNRYGSAINIIEKDGFNIDARIYNALEGTSLSTSAKTTGLGIIELSSVFNRFKPDIVVTIADRFETMSTAIAASYMNIPLAHIQGGEVTGNIDEKVRHAITKLSDYHFVASDQSYNRVLRLGEEKNSIYNTGCPSIDIAKKVLNKPIIDFEMSKKYPGAGKEINLKDKYLMVLQHPVTTEFGSSYKQILETLHAVHNLDVPVLWFWPNIDAGSNQTSKAIRKYREDFPKSKFYFVKNVEPDDFLKLAFNSECLIGNSSVGIRECSFLGVPVVNIGSRQNKRERGINVIDVNYNRISIEKAIKTQIKSDKYKSSDIFGKGNSGRLIADILSNVILKSNKTITY